MKYKLSEIGTVYSGGTPSTKKANYWDGNIAWITPKDLANYSEKYISHGERSITQEGLKSSSATIVPKGSVLMSSRAPIGYVVIAKNDVTTNQGFKSILCDESKCLNEYMYYWIKSNTDYIKSKANGSTFKEISGTSFKNLDIVLPDLEIQKKIVRILSALDQKIKLNIEALSYLQKFGESIINHINEAASSKIPLRDAVVLLRDGTHNPPKRLETGIPLIAGQTLNSGFIDYPKMTYISLADYEKIHAKYKPESNDLIITKIGTVGKVAILRESDIPIALHCNSAMIRFNQDVITQSYGYWLLCSDSFKTEFYKRITRTVQDFMSLSTMGEIPLLVPDKKTTDKYARIFEVLLAKRSALWDENKTLEDIRDTLLPKLMAGVLNIDKVEL